MKAIFSEDYRKLIAALKKARLAAGLSQTELSKKLGRSQSYISKVEQGQIRLDVIQLKQLADVLNLDYKKLLG
jgi:transcriptional regulator with XRE-family HTH domain